MAASIAKTLQHYLPAAPPGAEEWTHRLLRRTYASVLNAMKAPVDLIKRQLLHESIDAVDNYVAVFMEIKMCLICKNFFPSLDLSRSCPMTVVRL